MNTLTKQTELRLLLNLKGPGPFNPQIGDNVRVDVSVSELLKKGRGSGDKKETEIRERVQPYEGIIVATSGSGLRKTITVRRLFQGVVVERVFFVYAPSIKAFTKKKTT